MKRADGPCVGSDLELKFNRVFNTPSTTAQVGSASNFLAKLCEVAVLLGSWCRLLAVAADVLLLKRLVC